MTNWDSIRQAQADISEWADKEFPKRTTQGVFIKLLGELGELAANPQDPYEYADLLVLIFDYASLNKIDIPRALADKMAINKRRRWVFDEVTGLARHVKGRKSK